MLEKKKIELSYLPYGDVCKRSSNSQLAFDDAEYEEFEKDVLDALLEAENEEE